MMKNIITIAILCFLISTDLVAQDRASQIYNKITDPNNKEITVVAHRADWRYAPENSIAAIKRSIKQGVDVVEVDIQKTKDGEIILMHDKTLDRTTTGKGKISEWTLDSIRTLYLKNGASIRTIHRVPTLEEALLASKEQVMINLDKAYDIFDEVYPILVKTGTVNQIIMKGSKPVEKVKADFGKYLDEIIYMPIIHLDKPGALNQVNEFMKEIKPVAFEFLFASDTCQVPKIVMEQLEGKSKIWYNTLWNTMAGGHDDDMSLENPDAGYGYLIDQLGATILQTDRSDYLIEYLNQRNK